MADVSATATGGGTPPSRQRSTAETGAMENRRIWLEGNAQGLAEVITCSGGWPRESKLLAVAFQCVILLRVANPEAT